MLLSVEEYTARRDAGEQVHPDEFPAELDRNCYICGQDNATTTDDDHRNCR